MERAGGGGENEQTSQSQLRVLTGHFVFMTTPKQVTNEDSEAPGDDVIFFPFVAQTSLKILAILLSQLPKH